MSNSLKILWCNLFVKYSEIKLSCCNINHHGFSFLILCLFIFICFFFFFCFAHYLSIEKAWHFCKIGHIVAEGYFVQEVLNNLFSLSSILITGIWVSHPNSDYECVKFWMMKHWRCQILCITCYIKNQVHVRLFTLNIHNFRLRPHWMSVAGWGMCIHYTEKVCLC